MAAIIMEASGSFFSACSGLGVMQWGWWKFLAVDVKSLQSLVDDEEDRRLFVPFSVLTENP